MSYLKDMIYCLGDNCIKDNIIITPKELANMINMDSQSIYPYFRKYRNLLDIKIINNKRSIVLTTEGFKYYEKLKLTYEPNIKHSIMCSNKDILKEKLKSELQAHINEIIK